MRNVAFSILLVALAVVQIAVVSTELPKSHVHTTAAQHDNSAARVALATNETEHKASAL